MSAFCYIYNEIQELKSRATAIEKVNISSLQQSAKEIEALFKAMNLSQTLKSNASHLKRA